MQQETGFMIQHPGGFLVPHSFSYNRGTCIANWIKDIGMTWKECRKHGWKCYSMVMDIHRTGTKG